MIADTFLAMVQQSLPFALTNAQQDLVRRIADFVFSPHQRATYLLRGYAGTGKTSVMAAVIGVLKQLERDTVLLAPTGRAAKVLAQYAGFPAYTIHKKIYRQQNTGDIDARFDLDLNKHKNAVFIVDEASMMSDENSLNATFGTGSLLYDLINYVYSGSGCQLILVGDNAQLPPVGEEESPALNIAGLRRMGLSVSGYQLTTVMRQAQESGILHNATLLRMTLNSNPSHFTMPAIQFAGFDDVSMLSGSEIVDFLQSDYDRYGQEQVVVITRSNRQAVQYNLGIRNIIFGREEMLAAGDVIMVVRNNYYWTALAQADSKPADEGADDGKTAFLANGDIAVVSRVGSYYDFYGLHFADVSLRFPDYDDMELDVRVLLDTLTSEAPALTREQSEQLYQGVMEDYADIRTKKERMQKLRLDPNYNALQIKYAYAVTCHKAQGGQWRNVYLDQGWLPPDGISRAYYRWLYTAFTRASGHLYLVNWPLSQKG